ncbi:hypothetical protein [Humibacillus xanthopallidus]|uniref:hypothetical protein n=1 Tax=Humibacillus xanthopallidus TaxID=412689 RepID=UPI00385117C1
MAVRYEFRLAERLPPVVAAAFPELTESRAAGTGGSVLYGSFMDRAHLHALVNRFPAYGLTMVYLRQLPD